MGACGQSKPATDEEKQLICKAMAKDMMCLCLKDALEDPSKVKVTAPPALNVIKETSASLRRKAEEATAKAKEAGEGVGESGGEGGSGLVGAAMGMFGKLADAAGEVIEAGLEMGGAGLATALTKLADGLDKAIEQVETPMSTIGQEMVSGKKSEMDAALRAYLDDPNLQVPEAAKLCLGKEERAISQAIFTADSKKTVAEKWKPAVDEDLSKHKCIEAWKSCTDHYNGVCEQIEKWKLPLPEAQPKKAECDIKVHVCEQAVSEIMRLMGDAEVVHRGAPANKGALPEIFEKTFKKEKKDDVDFLTLKDYKAVLAAQNGQGKK